MINNNNRFRFNLNNDITSQFLTTDAEVSVDYKRGEALSNRVSLKWAIGNAEESTILLNNNVKETQVSNTVNQYKVKR